MRSLDELEALRSRLVEDVRAHPPHARNQTTAPGGDWTSVQVLQHLLLVETLVLSGFDRDARASGGARADRAQVGEETTTRRTLRDRVGALAVSLIFLLRIRVRMPTRRVDPVPPLSFEEVEERWGTVGAELARRLREAFALAPRKAVMRHPVSGPLTPEGAAAFLLSHMRHHERQLRRILAAGEGVRSGTPEK